MTGSRVPHFWSTKVRLLTNTTATRNGLVPPNGMAATLVSDRDVLGGQGVTAGAEHVEGTAVAEQHRLLRLLHHQLGAHLDLGAAATGEPVDDLLAGGVEVLENLECLCHQRPPFWVTSSKTVARSSKARSASSAASSRACERPPRRRSRQGLDALGQVLHPFGQGEVELVQAVELLVPDLHRVEEPGVAVVGVTDPVGEAVEQLLRARGQVEVGQIAGAGPLADLALQRLPSAVDLRRQLVRAASCRPRAASRARGSPRTRVSWP